MLSTLQQFILEACMEEGGAVSLNSVRKSRPQSTSKAHKEHFGRIITQSIDRLIARGLLTGYGVKTREKFFITRITLTPLGRRAASTARKKKQQTLPYVRNKYKFVYSSARK